MKNIKNTRKGNIQKVILETVKIAGVLSIAVLAPNALQVLGRFGKNDRQNKYYINRVTQKLVFKGLIDLEKKKEDTFVLLTKKGEDELEKYLLGDFKIKKPKRWDGKWRIVIFDIKEKRRKTRDILRDNLNRLGFIKLQNSVWVFPYDCEDLIILLKSSIFIGKDVLYLKVESIENDRWLKEVFGLD